MRNDPRRLLDAIRHAIDETQQELAALDALSLRHALALLWSALDSAEGAYVERQGVRGRPGSGHKTATAT
jgi:hypothetical protein